MKNFLRLFIFALLGIAPAYNAAYADTSCAVNCAETACKACQMPEETEDEEIDDEEDTEDTLIIEQQSAASQG